MPKHNLKDIELDEVSLVDKGANPGAQVVLFKRDDPTDMKVGPEEIKVVVADLIAATIDDDVAVEKADDYISADQLLKALSFNDMVALSTNREVMEGLGTKFGALHSSLISIVEDNEVTNKRMAAHESLNEFHESVLNSLKEVAKMADKKTDLEKLETKVADLTEKLEKAAGDIETLTKAKDDAEAKVVELEKAAEPNDGKDDITKGMSKAAKAEFKKMQDKQEASDKRIEKMEDEAITKAFVAKAEGYSNLPIDAEKLGAILKGVSGNIEKELYEEFEKMLAGTHEGMGKVFTQIGKDDGEGGGALEALNGKASEIAKRDNVTKEAAFVTALAENPELAKQERDERSTRH